MTKFRKIVLSIIAIAGAVVAYKWDHIYQMYALQKFNSEYKQVMNISNALIKEAKSLDLKNEKSKEQFISTLEKHHKSGVIVASLMLSDITGRNKCELLDQSLSYITSPSVLQVEIMNPDGTMKSIFLAKNCSTYVEKWSTMAKEAYESTGNTFTLLRKME